MYSVGAHTYHLTSVLQFCLHLEIFLQLTFRYDLGFGGVVVTGGPVSNFVVLPFILTSPYFLIWLMLFQLMIFSMILSLCFDIYLVWFVYFSKFCEISTFGSYATCFYRRAFVVLVSELYFAESSTFRSIPFFIPNFSLYCRFSMSFSGIVDLQYRCHMRLGESIILLILGCLYLV